MRLLVPAATGALVAAAVVLALLVFARPGAALSNSAAMDTSQLENEVAENSARLAMLENTLERLRSDLEILASRMGDMKEEHVESRENPDSEKPAENTEPPEKNSPSFSPEDIEPDSLKKLVKEQLKVIEEEKKLEWEKKRKEMTPDDWEKDEFGNHAWQVHSMGIDFDLNVTQKRKYFSIIKEHDDRVMGLWEELKKKNPDLDFKELGKIYQEERKAVLETTRNLVRNILNAAQQKTYDEKCRENDWIK